MTELIDAFVPISFRILNNPHGFGKWKNPLIDALARANGCKLQVVKPESKNADNAILFGRAANVRKAKRMFKNIQDSAFAAVCARMETEGVAKNDQPYSSSFYAGYVKGITEQLRDKIEANADEIDKVARQFPQSNQAYPVHTKIDAPIFDLGFAAGREARIVW